MTIHDIIAAPSTNIGYRAFMAALAIGVLILPGVTDE
jgi:hypothetical protein